MRKAVSLFFVLALVFIPGATERISDACDTMVALPDATTTASTILGKNSDRPIYDCQPLAFHARAKHARGEALKLEYVEIPQVTETYATIGSSPYWCWGYEEGVNEFGVAIGNEAIFTKTFAKGVAECKAGNRPSRGLLGMDLLRLGLERGKTAREALEVVCQLVAQHGQWGSGVPCVGDVEGGYDNSYIIADAKEAWVLETVGRRWIAKRFTGGVTSISNEPSIRRQWDLASPDIVDFSAAQGWWPADKKGSFDFALAYIDFKTPLHLSHARAMRSRECLAQKKEGKVSPRWMMRTLRDHYETTFLQGPYFNAALPDFLSICMHASPAGFTWGNTASSAVFILPESRDRLPVFWWTPGPPCTGLYIPFFVHGSKLPATVSRAGRAGKSVTPPPEAVQDRYSAESWWWQFRELSDLVKGDEIGSRYNERQPMVRAAFDPLEEKFAAEARKAEQKAVALRKAGKAKEATTVLDDFMATCVADGLAALKALKAKMAN